MERNIQIENEDNHELQQTFETTLEKVNDKWRRIYDTLEQQRLNKWMILNDTIYQLKSKMEDGIDATEAKWKLTLQKKENEMEFIKKHMEKDLQEAIGICKSLEDEMKKKQSEFDNKLKLKLNEKDCLLKANERNNEKGRLVIDVKISITRFIFS